MDEIDCIFYINLDHRTDRRDAFLAEMKKLGVPESKVIRISGIYNPTFGILGCGLSHKKALETFLLLGYKTCLIFEDDFTFTLDMNYVRFLLRQLVEQTISYDLIMLSGNIMKQESTDIWFLNKVLDGQTASGFLITREFAPKVVQALSESTVLLENHYTKTGEKKHEYCNDIYWKRLQPESNWYIVTPPMGIQRESYSDNEYKVTNYGV